MTLALTDVTVAYGSHAPALCQVSLRVPAGRTLAVVGPSGAGKSTLLRAIAGLLRPRQGDVRFDGESLLDRSPQERRIALIFQDDALWPHLSVRSNLRFALRERAGATDRVERAARAVHVFELLDRKPRELSGGERQRAAVARALLSDPCALLMDEPLAHLDPSLRRSVREDVLRVRKRFDGPIVYVTHDHAEAMSAGDELAVLIDGRIHDSGEPQRVYDRPATLAVARFLGERPMNAIDDGSQVLAIRPECIRIVPDAPLRGRVVACESTGADLYAGIETARGRLLVRTRSDARLRPGDRVALELPPESVRRFDRATGRAIA